MVVVLILSLPAAGIKCMTVARRNDSELSIHIVAVIDFLASFFLTHLHLSFFSLLSLSTLTSHQVSQSLHSSREGEFFPLLFVSRV